jgi:hypothetical protein
MADESVMKWGEDWHLVASGEKEMRGWRLYYGDGSTFDSWEGSWEEAPSDNVQILMLYFEPPYKSQIAGWDDYELPPSSEKKYGKSIPEEHFYSIQHRAVVEE